MKVLFIGIGSIASRHIRNLRKMFGGSLSITGLRSKSGRKLAPDIPSMIDYIYTDENSLDTGYDAVFITNPTSKHYDTLLRHRERSQCFFIEKPVFHRCDMNLGPFLNDGKLYYVACPLRYTDTVQYLKTQVDFKSVHAMRCISSSYLPGWRPGIDYRDTYSAHKNLGGGVSIDLIHEWDYIHYLAGSPTEVKSFICKKSGLEIDCDDIAVYIAEYPDKIVELHLDYFGRETVRKIELYMDNDTLYADLVHQKVHWLKENKIVEFPQDRDSYQERELRHFFDMAAKKYPASNGLVQAQELLRIAMGK